MNNLSPFLLYSVKVAIALALLYLPYRLLLSRLTFFKSNRFYLLGYSLLSLLVPLLNLGSIFPRIVNQYGSYFERAHPILPMTTGTFIRLRPGPPIKLPLPADPLPWYTSAILGYIVVIGMAFMLIRLLIQIASFLRLKWRSTLVTNDPSTGIRLYSMKDKIVPFSLGKDIFVHLPSYEPQDMHRIIEHESAHIKQKHTLDIVFTQLLMVFQWWNPFIWLLQSSVRQNLEFLADQSVLEQGEDYKKYQYLLLNVSGHDAPSLSNSFNRSPLRQRIVMMNKKHSSKIAAISFLFCLPLLLLMLAAFSRHQKAGLPGDPSQYHLMGFTLESRTLTPLKGVTIMDSVSGLTTLSDDKGYFDLALPIDYSKDSLHIKTACHKNGMDGSGPNFGVAVPTFGPFHRYLFGNFGTFCLAFKGDSICKYGNPTQSLPLPNDSTKSYTNRSSEKLIKDRDNFATAIYKSRQLDSTIQSVHQIYYYVDGITHIRNDKGVSFTQEAPVDVLLINDSVRMTGEEINRRYSEDQVYQVYMLGNDELKKFGSAQNGFSIWVKEKSNQHPAN